VVDSTLALITHDVHEGQQLEGTRARSTDRRLRERVDASVILQCAMGAPTGSLSIIVPAFNEARLIRHTLDALRAYLLRTSLCWEVRVVDDGSSDDTCAIVSGLAKQDQRIVLQADLRFLCDADLSMPLAEFPRFLEAVPARCDIAIGTQEGAGARRVGEPGHRHAIGRAFNGLVRALALTDLHDTQCRFKLFSAAAADAVFRRVTLEGWAFDIEAMVIARRLGYRLQALPIEWHYREQSRVRPIRDSLLMARDVARIRFSVWAGTYGTS
jgi:dolichyl-phosphate beta-glucosyltransferase